MSEKERERERERQTDRQTDRQTQREGVSEKERERGLRNLNVLTVEGRLTYHNLYD